MTQGVIAAEKIMRPFILKAEDPYTRQKIDMASNIY